MGLVFALIAVIASAAPAAAYTVVSESGEIGYYNFFESTESPRARCIYGGYVGDKQYLRRIRVGPPTVFAAHPDYGRVGWRFLIQRLNNDMVTWTTVAKSPIQKARAYLDEPAHFDAMRVDYSPSNVMRTFRALVVINWYRPNGTVQGQARIAPDYYQFRDPDGPPYFTLDDSCGGGWQRV